ncbi:unnamed protein product [Closterium sp. NIES-54]
MMKALRSQQLWENVTLHSLDYWVIDSGTTYSMTPRVDLLTELEPSPLKHVTSALGQRAEVKGMGKAMFKGADGKMVGLKNNEMVAGIRVKGEPDEVLGCPTRMQAKFTRYPFSSSEATAKAPLDEVVMNVVGPLKLGAAGAEYFLTIVDVYTRMTWVYVLSKKSDVAETVKTDCYRPGRGGRGRRGGGRHRHRSRRRRALLPCTARAQPCSPRRALPCPAAPPSPAEPSRPARAALPNPSCAALPHSPAPSSRPAATTAAAAAALATATAGGGAAGAGAVAVARAGQQQSLPLPDDPNPHQLREWAIQQGSPGGGGFGFMGTAQRWQQGPQSTFSLQRPRDSASQRSVPGCVEAAALGSSESAAAPGAGESAAALGARESADALGASAPTATGPASAEALHTFTLDSGVSRCFFRDCTTVTPLVVPVPVSLADPNGGPDEWVDTFILGGQRVAICKCSRIGRHLATFTRLPGSSLYTLTCASAHVVESGQVAASSWVSASGQLAVSCSCRVLSHQTLLWHHRQGHPSLPRLRSVHSRLLVSGIPRSLPSLPRLPAPPCLPCVEGR